MDRLLISPPAVGDKYRGGVVTRRQRTPQGEIRLLVDGQGWINYDPVKMPETSGQPCKHETKVKTPETSPPDDIGLGDCYLWRIGDLVRYVGRDPELREQLPKPVPITKVLNPDRMLWVRRPDGLEVSVPMSAVEVAQ